MKNKLILLISVFAITFSTVKAQDADCPCWGEKKAFVAEVYSYNGIGRVAAYNVQPRLFVVPGLSAGMKFNKKNTLMIGVNFLSLKKIYMGPFLCDPFSCPNCFDNTIIELMAEWKYRTLWKKNFHTDLFVRIGPDFLIYQKAYYKNYPEVFSTSNHISIYRSPSIVAGYNFLFKMSKNFYFCVAPYFQYNSHSNISDWYSPYHFFGGIKAGLKYSKYLN